MAAVLITRREATAEASLARRRDLRKLGTAIAAMIMITATTRSSSIRENPLWLRMNTPEPSASVGGRGPGRVGKESFERRCIIPRRRFYSNQHVRESSIFVEPPGTWGRPGGGPRGAEEVPNS